MYDNLLRTPFVRSRVVALPLAGEVTIYVVRNDPFPPDSGWLTSVEESARIIEEFMGEPFPTTDVILVVLNTDPSSGGVNFEYRHEESRSGPVDGGFYSGNQMWMFRPDDRVVREDSVITHETAHYYFHIGPLWLVEGGAEFMTSYVLHGPSRHLRSWVGDICRHDDEPIENIRHYNYIRDHVYDGDFGSSRGARLYLCAYVMGEVFLGAVFDAIGEEAMSAAVRELYLERESTTEEDIYRAFLRHAPEDRKDVFRYVYRRLHGGEYAFDAAQSQAASEAVGRVFEHISWFEDPPDGYHIKAARNIFTMWIWAPGFGERIARMAWLEDGVTEDESWAIRDLADIAAKDAELANMVANFPWFIDGMTEDEAWVIGALANIAAEDTELATMVANLPWFTDGVTVQAVVIINDLGKIAAEDTELAMMVANLPGFTDGVTARETWAIDYLANIVAEDAELAMMVANLPWFGDGVTDTELQALREVRRIVSDDLDLARRTVEQSWFADGIVASELEELRQIGR